jgi:hypothetical protein
VLAAKFGIGNKFLLFLLPVIGHRTILCQVVVVIELLLLFDNAVEHFCHLILDTLSDACKSEDFFENAIHNFTLRQLAV